jgi:hypothetical protein
MSDKTELPDPEEAAAQVVEALRAARALKAGEDVEGHVFDDGDDVMGHAAWSINVGCACAAA